MIERLHLTAANLLGCLCPEQNNLPYWHMVHLEGLMQRLAVNELEACES